MQLSLKKYTVVLDRKFHFLFVDFQVFLYTVFMFLFSKLA